MSNKFHFIGIGGIGMSALARMLLKQKKIISGSDLFINKITEKLIEKGATIYKGHDKKNVEKNSTVVISTAIKEDNPEYLIAKKMKLKIIHRSDLLNDLISDKFSILVTGSHGKTTTSSLLSYVLHHSSLDPSFVVGGILNNFSKNSHLGEGPHFIAEADESDGSMLKTTPTAAIITNIDREHMDYWKTEKNLFSGFSKFIKNVNSKEHFFWCCDDENLRKISKEGYSYGFSKDADLKIFNFIQKEFQICS